MGGYEPKPFSQNSHIAARRQDVRHQAKLSKLQIYDSIIGQCGFAFCRTGGITFVRCFVHFEGRRCRADGSAGGFDCGACARCCAGGVAGTTGATAFGLSGVECPPDPHTNGGGTGKNWPGSGRLSVLIWQVSIPGIRRTRTARFITTPLRIRRAAAQSGSTATNNSGSIYISKTFRLPPPPGCPGGNHAR